MIQTLTRTAVAEWIYPFIGDAGAVTLEELVTFLGLPDFPVEAWLRSQVDAGYVYRDEFGTYSTSCPWPRIGF